MFLFNLKTIDTTRASEIGVLVVLLGYIGLGFCIVTNMEGLAQPLNMHRLKKGNISYALLELRYNKINRVP